MPPGQERSRTPALDTHAAFPENWQLGSQQTGSSYCLAIVGIGIAESTSSTFDLLTRRLSPGRAWVVPVAMTALIAGQQVQAAPGQVRIAVRVTVHSSVQNSSLASPTDRICALESPSAIAFQITAKRLRDSRSRASAVGSGYLIQARLCVQDAGLPSRTCHRPKRETGRHHRLIRAKLLPVAALTANAYPARELSASLQK